MLNLVCLLEEPSAKEMLIVVLGKLFQLDQVCVRYIVFEGKQHLEKKLQERIQGYRAPHTCFLVIRDQDSGDCAVIKNSLKNKVAATGKADRTLIRIACHELESFFLGDLNAVVSGLKLTSSLARQQENNKFSNPDRLANPAQILKKITGEQYQKMTGSRAISPYMKLEGNKSASFNALIAGVKQLVQQEAGR